MDKIGLDFVMFFITAKDIEEKVEKRIFTIASF